MWRNGITVTRRSLCDRSQQQNWPGATPFGEPLARPNARSGFGVAPGQFLPRQTKNQRTMNMPLLNLPKPELPRRKNYVKIHELLAITMEKKGGVLPARKHRLRHCASAGYSLLCGHGLEDLA
jgi:hypothetical protein